MEPTDKYYSDIIGEAQLLSFHDVQIVNAMYKCSGWTLLFLRRNLAPSISKEVVFVTIIHDPAWITFSMKARSIGHYKRTSELQIDVKMIGSYIMNIDKEVTTT